MKKSLLLLVIFIVSMIGSTYAQPRLWYALIPKGKIPSGIPAKIKKEIERLYSADSIERGYAAKNLGDMGKEAISAIPFLLGVLSDATPLEWRQGDVAPGYGEETNPGRIAAEALGKIKDTNSVEPLLDALINGDVNTRMNAMVSLGGIKDPRAVGPLINALRDPNDKIRRFAAKALGEIGNPKAVEPLLLVALKDEDSKARGFAASALGKIGDPKVVTPLFKVLTSPEGADSFYFYSAAINAFVNIKNSEATNALISIIKNKSLSESLRATATEAIGAITDKIAVECLIEALSDEKRLVRANAAEALGKIGDVGAVDGLILLLEDHAVWDRAVLALGKLRDTRAVVPLIAALQKSDSTNRFLSIADALVQIKDLRAVEPLISFLKGKATGDDGVYAVSQQLKKLTGKDLGTNYSRWQNWWNKNKAKYGHGR